MVVGVGNGLITEEEAALYDRQIRLWGMESQSRLKKSNVLLIGMNFLAAEIAKNIVLAGVASLTVLDNDFVTQEDCKNNFLIAENCLEMTRAKASVNRLQKLNPMVRVKALELIDQETYSHLSGYEIIVVVTNCSNSGFSAWTMLNKLLEDQNSSTRPCIVCATTTAHFGLIFVNLWNHDFVAEDVVLKTDALTSNCLSNTSKTSSQSVRMGTVLNKQIVNYPPLESTFSLNWVTHTNKLISKHIPKGFFLMQLLRECLYEEAPYCCSYLHSQWEKVASQLGVETSVLSEDDLISCAGPSVSAVSAVLGGIVSQEIIRAITRKGKPQGNWYFFDGLQCSVTVEWLPKLEE